jgi:hypothetical protein
LKTGPSSKSVVHHYFKELLERERKEGRKEGWKEGRKKA